MLTGKNRLQRGLNFMSYLKHLFPGSKPVWSTYNGGHSAGLAYASKHFTAWAFEDFKAVRETGGEAEEPASPDGEDDGEADEDQEQRCTAEEGDPYASGAFVDCCGDLVKTFDFHGKEQRHYICKPASPEGEDDGEDDEDREQRCTAEEGDPYASGAFIECCGDLVKTFGKHGTKWLHYICKPASPEGEDGGEVDEDQEQGCTAEEDDPYASGAFVECCGDLVKTFDFHGKEQRHYICKPASSDGEADDEADEDQEQGCTAEDGDPYASGAFVECCGDLVKTFGKHGKKWLHYICKQVPL